MTSQIDDHLTRLRSASEACVAETLRAHRGNLGEVHLLDADVAEWLAKITGPETEQIEAARRELALAEYSIASGLYRQAFAGLRLFLELSFAAVHFSVNEFERRQWYSDRTDFSWSAALDEDNGVLSTRFVIEFFSELTEDAKAYSRGAAQCYRHCSQFVHGKVAVARSLPETLEYRASVVGDWCDWAQRAGEAVLFLFLVRYGADLRAHEDDSLSEILAGRFGHLTSVRELLGLAEEQ